MNNKNNKPFLKILIISTAVVAELLLFRLSSNFATDLIPIIIIMLNTIISSIIFLWPKNKINNIETTANKIIATSIIIRVILLLIDIYAGWGLFTGKDTENFYECALGINNGYNTNSYSILLHSIAGIIGTKRIVLEYINIIAAFISLIYFKKAALLISKSKKTVIIAVAIFSLSPINIFLSSSLLREPIMIMLNCISIYYFILWFKAGKKLYLLHSLMAIIISTWLHSGMILVLLALLISYVLYEPKIKKISLRKNTLFALILALIVAMAIMILSGKALTKYFQNFSSLDSTGASTVSANADYLPQIKHAPLSTKLLFLPIEVVYFYLSPMIWDIRTVSMIIAILFSSSLYLYFFIQILTKNKHKIPLNTLLMIIIICATIPYAMGVSNAGTAMRHREKILPFIALAYVVKKGKKYENIN